MSRELPRAQTVLPTLDASDAAFAKTVAELSALSEVAEAEAAVYDASRGPRYERLRLLGEGGMGVVHVALDRQFGREVALKELRSSARGAESLRRFAVEALITGNLEHPGIPPVYERGVADGRPFYAMRKVEGRTLQDALDQASTLPERLALLPAIVQVANTLGFAHARGVVHRDVKPENVLLASHGAVVLLDWGIAKFSGDSEVGAALVDTIPESGKATASGAVLGTPAYMAPEQARGDGPAIDARTDVFALGALLYRLLAGHEPFRGETPMAVLYAALSSERAPVASVAPDAPQGLCAIVEKAMAVDPKNRFANAEEVASALSRFMNEAVTAKPSLVARLAAGLATVVALVALTGAAAFLALTMPGVVEQGIFGVLPYSVLCGAGLLVSAVEWRTRGRHHLVSLARALGAATFLAGVSGSYAGFAWVGRAVMDTARTRASEVAEVAGQGAWEASGAIAVASILAALQLVVAEVAARAAQRE